MHYMSSFTPNTNKYGVLLYYNKLFYSKLFSGRVYAAMDAETRQFLAQFKSNLDSVFTKERSQRYLELMPQHLEIYYRDNIDELEKTRVKMSRRVEGNIQNISYYHYL